MPEFKAENRQYKSVKPLGVPQEYVDKMRAQLEKEGKEGGGREDRQAGREERRDERQAGREERRRT